ncbi:MAG TPA: histidine kinase dimerization/phospho-acceptor domain-containing protein, partial [Rhodocyclaceae bacterium]
MTGTDAACDPGATTLRPTGRARAAAGRDAGGVLGGRWKLFRQDGARVASLPALAYLGLLALTQWIDTQSSLTHGAAGYWLSGGVMAAALLQLHRRSATWVVIGGCVMSFIGNAVTNGSALESWLGALADLASVMLAVVLARRVSGAALDLCQPRRLMNFVLRAAVPASVLSAALHFPITNVATAMGMSASLLDATYQFIAHFLSLLLVTPTLLMLSQHRRSELIEHLRKPGALGQLALMAAVTAVAFMQTAVPLLFLAFPPLVYLALRQPPTVVAVAMVLMASISGVATANGHGPVHTFPVMNFVGLEALPPTLQRLSLYNLFLMSVIISILPISSVMNERRRIATALEARTLSSRMSAVQAKAALEALNVERSENAAREAFYQKLVEIMPAFLIVKNASDGSFVLVNPAAREALGIDPDTCIGKKVIDLFPGDEAEASAAEDRQVIESRKVAIDTTACVTTAAGETKYYTTRKVAVFDGDTPSYIVTAGQDVTEQVKAQSALEQAVDAAERANSAKSQFLANMSHELRTPLNGIIAMADMLLDVQADDRSRRMVGTIVESGRMLEHVVNDILDVAKIEAGQMKLESAPFDLDSVIAGISALHKAAAVGKGLELELDIDPAASGVYLGDRT